MTDEQHDTELSEADQKASGNDDAAKAWAEMTTAIGEIGQAFEAFKEANDKRLEALEDGKVSGTEEVLKALGEIGQAFEQFKEANDKRLEALEGGEESLAAALDRKLDKMSARIAKVEAALAGVA